MAKTALEIQTQYFCPDSLADQTLQRAGYRFPEQSLVPVCVRFTPQVLGVQKDEP